MDTNAVNGLNTQLVTAIPLINAMKILEVKSPTLHGYIRKGYLTRVLGLGRRAIGINGNSLEAFRHRRIVHKGKVRQ